MGRDETIILKFSWGVFNRVTWVSVPCVLVLLVLFSGEAWARAGRLFCKSGGCDNPIFGSFAIIMGVILIVGPFYPPIWRFMSERTDGSIEDNGPVWKVSSVIFGVFAVGMGIYLVG